ncbi:hypothetical protein EVAR_59813_1 [Eumeta japonica]|uniref:Uncharacterized protein n=1 Tax=Eumeta variegata TaxID=151549 RepID=A0A4C1YG34_EUMVA|nr:hypothetical protein EVAR_59813_1 [Eumeta japonica]
MTTALAQFTLRRRRRLSVRALQYEPKKLRKTAVSTTHESLDAVMFVTKASQWRKIGTREEEGRVGECEGLRTGGRPSVRRTAYVPPRPQSGPAGRRLGLLKGDESAAARRGRIAKRPGLRPRGGRLRVRAPQLLAAPAPPRRARAAHSTHDNSVQLRLVPRERPLAKIMVASAECAGVQARVGGSARFSTASYL